MLSDPRDIPIMASPSCSESGTAVSLALPEDVRSGLTADDRLGDGVATVVSEFSGPKLSSDRRIWRGAHIRANPTTQMTDPLIPWAIRARAMTQ